MSYEYKVVPAPTRGRKARGVKTPADRFALALETAINALAAEGWEFQRSETLPAEERHGLAKRTTVDQNMLVFRRPVAAEETTRPEPEVRVKTPAPSEPAAHPGHNTLDRMIEHEIAAARAPRLPSAGEAQEPPDAPIKAPGAHRDQTGTTG